MTHELLVAAKVIVLALGLAIASLAFLAYRRSRSRLLLGLAVGFALVAFGSFVEGILYEVLGRDLATGHVVESAFVVAGLSLIALLLRPRAGKSVV